LGCPFVIWPDTSNHISVSGKNDFNEQIDTGG
jgi:hypothetical protein